MPPSSNCIWCDKPLKPGEQPGGECDNCWELRTRIDANPDLARRMLAVNADLARQVKSQEGGQTHAE